MRQYDTVRVVAIRNNRFEGEEVFYKRSPQVGDVGCILEVYENPVKAFEVECSDPTDGSTIWLEAMFPEELAENT